MSNKINQSFFVIIIFETIWQFIYKHYLVKWPCRFPVISMFRWGFGLSFTQKRHKAHNMKTDGMFAVEHFHSTAMGSLEGLLGSSSTAISVAGRSSRNPNSFSGTFLRVQSKRDRLLSGLPKTSTYARGFHPRPTNFLPFTNLPLPMKSFTVTHSKFLQP